MRFRECDVGVPQVTSDSHCPHPVEIYVRPRQNELQLGARPDNRAARGRTRRSNHQLVFRIQANDHVFHVTQRFAHRSLQFEPGLAFDIGLSVRGHNSNVARITEWQGPFTFKMKSMGGPQDTFDTLSGTVTLNTAFRADIRSYRQVIHDPPVPPVAPGFELIPPLSSAPYSCTGGAQNVAPGPPPFILTYTWTGSGNLQPFDLSSASFGFLPPTQWSSSGGILMGTASSLPLNLTLEAHGGNTECTATITSNTGESSMFTFDIPFGAINLSLNLDPVTAVIPAPQSPLQFPNTGCLFTPGDSSCNVSLNWSAISPVGNSAPDPKAAQ
jgi:hypothetical protein